MQWFVKFVLIIEMPNGDKQDFVFKGRAALRYICGLWEASGAPKPSLKQVTSKIAARFLNSRLDIIGWARVQPIPGFHMTSDPAYNTVLFRPAGHEFWPVRVPEPISPDPLPRTLSEHAAHVCPPPAGPTENSATATTPEASAPLPDGRNPGTTGTEATTHSAAAAKGEIDAQNNVRSFIQPPPRLENINLSCSLNAVLHCIVRTKPLTAFFKRQLKAKNKRLAQIAAVITAMAEGKPPSGEQLKSTFDDCIKPLLGRDKKDCMQDARFVWMAISSLALPASCLIQVCTKTFFQFPFNAHKPMLLSYYLFNSLYRYQCADTRALIFGFRSGRVATVQNAAH